MNQTTKDTTEKKIAAIIVSQLADGEDFGNTFDCGDEYTARIDYEPGDTVGVAYILAHVFAPHKVKIATVYKPFEYPEDDNNEDPTEFANRFFRRDNDYFNYLYAVVDDLAADIMDTIEGTKIRIKNRQIRQAYLGAGEHLPRIHFLSGTDTSR